MPSWAAYFYLYEAFKELYSKINTKGTDKQRQRREFFGKLMSGGLAGVGSWLVSYPFDIIKT